MKQKPANEQRRERTETNDFLAERDNGVVAVPRGWDSLPALPFLKEEI